MTDDPGSPPAPRARALPELPLEIMAARSEELAKRWAIALVAARAMEDLGAIPLEEIARDGPALCAAVLAALGSDVELQRLTGRGGAEGRGSSAPARRIGLLAGARDALATVEAVEALRGVLWETLLDELSWQSTGGSSARRLAELGDRLAYVCAEVLAAALADGSPPASPPGAASAPSRQVDVADPPAPAGARVVIVDERTSDEPRAPGASGPVQALSSWEGPAQSSGSGPAEIEVRDQRGEKGSPVGSRSLAAALEQFERDRLPFALLLVEPLDAELSARPGSSAEDERLAAELERVLADELRARLGGGFVMRERRGRHLLLVAEADRLGASALAGRLARSVPESLARSGRPLRLAIGTAACPQDGRDSTALLAHAEVGLHAARSALRASPSHAAGTIDG